MLPDILANSGGVTVSYFEWVQDIENEKWDGDLEPANLRSAALVLAIDRVATVALGRRIWP